MQLIYFFYYFFSTKCVAYSLIFHSHCPVCTASIYCRLWTNNWRFVPKAGIHLLRNIRIFFFLPTYFFFPGSCRWITCDSRYFGYWYILQAFSPKLKQTNRSKNNKIKHRRDEETFKGMVNYVISSRIALCTLCIVCLHIHTFIS